MWYNVYCKGNEVMNHEAMIRSWPVSEVGADAHPFPLCSLGESAAGSQQQADWATHTFYSGLKPTAASMLLLIGLPTIRTGCKKYCMCRFPSFFLTLVLRSTQTLLHPNHKGQHKFWRSGRRVKAGSLKLQVILLREINQAVGTNTIWSHL